MLFVSVCWSHYFLASIPTFTLWLLIVFNSDSRATSLTLSFRMNHYTDHHLYLTWTGKFVIFLILVHALPLQCFARSSNSVNLDSIEWLDDQFEESRKDDRKESTVSTGFRCSAYYKSFSERLLMNVLSSPWESIPNRSFILVNFSIILPKMKLHAKNLISKTI